MYALLNVYFYGTRFNQNLGTSFKSLIQGDDDELYALMRKEDTPFAKFIEKNVIT
jgi:hypothetical protein